MKQSILALLFLGLWSCQPGSQYSDIANQEIDWSKVDFDSWDDYSKQTIQKFLKSIPSSSSQAKKTKLAEILILHGYHVHAIYLLKQLETSKSQYLTYLLAIAYYQQGELEQTILALNSISDSFKQTSLINLKLKTLLDLGHSEKILELANSSLEETIYANSLSKYFVAMAYLQVNQCQSSIPLFKQVVQANPKANKIYAPLARAYQQCQQDMNAKNARLKQGNVSLPDKDEFYSRLFKNGDPVGFYNQLLIQAVDKNHTQLILDYSEKIIQLNAQNPTVLINYAISLYQSRQLKLANKALYESIQIDSKNVKPYQLLFEFNRIENKHIAEKAIDQLLIIEPQNKLYQQAKNYLNEQK